MPLLAANLCHANKMLAFGLLENWPRAISLFAFTDPLQQKPSSNTLPQAAIWYVSRRLPAPQNSSEDPAQSMLQSVLDAKVAPDAAKEVSLPQ
jgi:hypothetical protein